MKESFYKIKILPGYEKNWKYSTWIGGSLIEAGWKVSEWTKDYKDYYQYKIVLGYP